MWKPSLKKLKNGLTPGKAAANRLTAQESELLHNLSNWQWEKAVESREVSKKRQSQMPANKQPLHLHMTPIHRPDQDQQTPKSDYFKRKSLPKMPRMPSSTSSVYSIPYASELPASEPKRKDRKPSLPKLTFEDEEDLQEFISSSCFAAAQDIHFWAIDIEKSESKPKDIPTKFIAELPTPDSQRTSTSTSTSTQSRDSLLIEDIMEFLKPRKRSTPRITSWFDDEKDDSPSIDAAISDEKEVMSDTSLRLDKSAGSSFEIYRGTESE